MVKASTSFQYVNIFAKLHVATVSPHTFYATLTGLVEVSKDTFWEHFGSLHATL